MNTLSAFAFGGERAHERDGVVYVLVRDQFVVERAADDAFIVDDVGDTSVESNDGPEDIVGFGDAFVGVPNHGKLDVQGLRKVALRAVFVRGHANDFAAESDDFLVCVAKPRRLDRSPRSECFGKEVEHNDFAAEFGKADLLSGRRECFECGSVDSNSDHGARA